MSHYRFVVPRRRILLPLLVILVGAGVGPRGAPAEDAPSPQQPWADAVLGAVLGPSPLEEDLHFLCDRIGGRPTGSPAMQRAVDWSVERFREAGVDRVVAESFRMPMLWRWVE